MRATLWDGDPVDVQVLGWDEAFVALRPGALGPPDDERDAEAFARQLHDEVLAATGLHLSVGIGDNKLQAKIATDFGKPQGVSRLSDATWFAVMGERSTRALWGVGAKTAAKLAVLGVETVTQLAQADPRLLAERLGPTMGPWYRRLGRGVDTSPVDPTPYVAQGHGREETFQTDLETADDVRAAVRRLAHAVAADIAAEGRPALRVGLKVRFRPFVTVTRSRTLPAPETAAEPLADVAVELLDRLLDERDDGGGSSRVMRPVRLLGVRLEMLPPDTDAAD